jgi:2-Cys peroxiredoxin 5
LYDPRFVNAYQIRFIADPALKFTKALDLSFDGAAIFGGDRSKRYALVVEDGKVKEAYVEPDNTGVKGKTPDLERDLCVDAL